MIDSKRCEGKTKKGVRCKFSACEGMRVCKKHKDYNIIEREVCEIIYHNHAPGEFNVDCPKCNKNLNKCINESN